MSKGYADHILHFTPDPYGGSWRLECAPHGEHFTVLDDIEEWGETAEELEAEGIKIDRSTCWVHDLARQPRSRIMDAFWRVD